MINIFTPDKKIQKDRQVMKIADFTLAQRSIQGSIGFMLMYPVSAMLCGFFQSHAAVTWTFGILIIVVNGLRCALAIKFEKTHASGPNRWRNIFFTLAFAAAFTWSAYISFAVWQITVINQLFIPFVFTSAMAAIVLVVCSAFLRYVQLYISILLLPLSLTSIGKFEAESLIAGLIMLSYWGFLILESRPLYESYWERMEANLLLKKKAYDLEISKAASEKSNHIKDQFLSNMNHEFKTPLNSVLGMLALLGDTKLSKEQREFQSVAMKSGESLLSLINDILDYSQITTNTLTLESIVFNPRKMLEECIEALGPTAHARGLELVGMYDTDLPIRIRSDSKRIAQIINNLIINAIQHSHEGEIIIKASLNWIDENNGELKVEVTDQGTGVEVDKQAKIFDAFSRATPPQDDTYHSTGLGLTIAKGLARNMEGDIGVISDTGIGSTFWMTAKVRISSRRPQPWTPTEDLAGLNTLLINIPTFTLDNVTRLLKECSIETHATNEMEEALIALERDHYHLVIINMIAPDSACYDFSAQLATRHPSIKQIMLTSLLQRGSPSTHQHEQTFVDTNFITKPIKLNELYRTICIVMKLVDDTFATQIETLHTDADTDKIILLVEDNHVNRLVACKMLEKLGFQVKSAVNGNEALGLLSNNNEIGLVLMDCQMPELDGYDTTRIIRERETYREHLPIIAMTANAMEGDEARCLAAGMDDYLAKPVGQEDLRIIIKRWIHHSKDNVNNNHLPQQN